MNANLVRLAYPVIARWMRIKVVEYEGFPYAHVAYIHHHVGMFVAVVTAILYSHVLTYVCLFNL